MENEIKEQIERCKSLQQQCRLEDTEEFLKLSRRITELSGMLETNKIKEKEIQRFKVRYMNRKKQCDISIQHIIAGCFFNTKKGERKVYDTNGNSNSNS